MFISFRSLATWCWDKVITKDNTSKIVLYLKFTNMWNYTINGHSPSCLSRISLKYLFDFISTFIFGSNTSSHCCYFKVINFNLWNNSTCTLQIKWSDYIARTTTSSSIIGIFVSFNSHSTSNTRAHWNSGYKIFAYNKHWEPLLTISDVRIGRSL